MCVWGGGGWGGIRRVVSGGSFIDLCHTDTLAWVNLKTKCLALFEHKLFKWVERSIDGNMTMNGPWKWIPSPSFHLYLPLSPPPPP